MQSKLFLHKFEVNSSVCYRKRTIRFDRCIFGTLPRELILAYSMIKILLEWNTSILATIKLHCLVEWMDKHRNWKLHFKLLCLHAIVWLTPWVESIRGKQRKRTQNSWSIDTSFKCLKLNSTSATWWRDWNFRLKFRFKMNKFKCQCDIQTCTAGKAPAMKCQRHSGW